MRRLFVELGDSPHPRPPAAIPLEPDEAHYATRVLRLTTGDAVELLDGGGKRAVARLALDGKTLVAQLEAPFALAEALVAQPPLTVAVAPPKGERADWMVEKLAELGVSRVVLVTTERSVVVPNDKLRARLTRVMRAAARQARHGRVPELVGPMALGALLVTERLGPSQRFLLDGQGHHALLQEPTGAQLLLIGPEGGLSPAELQAAQQAAYTPVKLGPHVLRVETAAVMAAGLWHLMLAGAHPPKDLGCSG